MTQGSTTKVKVSREKKSKKQDEKLTPSTAGAIRSGSDPKQTVSSTTQANLPTLTTTIGSGSGSITTTTASGGVAVGVGIGGSVTPGIGSNLGTDSNPVGVGPSAGASILTVAGPALKPASSTERLTRSASPGAAESTGSTSTELLTANSQALVAGVGSTNVVGHTAGSGVVNQAGGVGGIVLGSNGTGVGGCEQ